MVEKMGFIRDFLFAADSWSFAHTFQTCLDASNTRELIPTRRPLFAASTACFRAWKSSRS